MLIQSLLSIPSNLTTAHASPSGSFFGISYLDLTVALLNT